MGFKKGIPRITRRDILVKIRVMLDSMKTITNLDLLLVEDVEDLRQEISNIEEELSKTIDDYQAHLFYMRKKHGNDAAHREKRSKYLEKEAV
jgi:hypothetical protein